MPVDWKKLISANTIEVFGLDIDTSAVKAVQMSRNGKGFKVKAAAIVYIDNAADSRESARLNIARAITTCLQSAEIQTQLAVCGLCGPEVAVRDFTFPELSHEEIKSAVPLEAEQVCPFDIGDSAVDYQLIRQPKNNVSGILVAATKKLVRAKKQLAKKASINVALMDVNGLALLNCFSQCGLVEPGKTAAVLNVDSSFTNLAIISDDSVPFVRDIACGADDIIKEIAQTNNVSPEIVNKWLSNPENAGKTQVEIDQYLAGACKRLIVDINETLRYYTAHKKSNVDQLFICGRFALVGGFIELLESRLSAQAILWNPFDKIKPDEKFSSTTLLEKKGPELAVAAGLAMRSI